MTLDLFGGAPPRVRAAPASAPFLDLIAQAMCEALWRENDPFSLSDALVLLPNRRSARGLADAFARTLGGAALLPTIRPLGDVADEDNPDVWGPEPLALDIPPAIEPTRQRMELAALIRARDRAAGGVEDPVRAIALADELRKLMESAATVDKVAWERLPSLADEVDLARHWEASAAFLDIVATYWPKRLAADGLCDPSQRRSMLLHALAREWTYNPPRRAIVIAGSTGSIAATRQLMACVSQLDRGVVILPGLDAELDDDAWHALGEQHPQWALKQTLAALGVARQDVRLLGGEDEPARARRVLMREALAPAEQTADWLARIAAAGGVDLVAAGAAGIQLIEAATEDEEAAAIALLLRQSLEQPNQTAALATPDSGLARRVEAKLMRWGVHASATHGRPLIETEAGRLAALLCELASDPGEPVALAALLKHPRVRIGAQTARTALEHAALRGPRRHRTLRELEALDTLGAAAGARDLVRRLEAALAPLTDAATIHEVSLTAFADAIALAAQNLAFDQVWAGSDGECLSGLLREIIAHGGELGVMQPHAAARVLMRLLAAAEAPSPRETGNTRIHIWGPLEARLQRCDLMILGGLNEGVWPAPPGEDAFLSRPMRAALGLPSLDQRIGLAAHDFAQLVSAPNVVLTRALRREGAPALASRWLWRLETLLHGAAAQLPRADHILTWARAMDGATTQRRTSAPRPRPPADKRLTRISVTQVETLIRDPYALYARRLLGLEVLKPIGVVVGPSERGVAIHRAVERFEDDGDPARLRQLLDEELQRAGVAPERRAAERIRIEQSVRMLIAWLLEREAGARVFKEARGALALACGVTLTGIADRLEIDVRGGAILDFKTGTPPSDAQVESGLAPQLPLEAAMLARGAFDGVAATQAHELVYWRFGGANPAPRIVHLEAGAHGAGEAALAKLEKLLERYAVAEQPFLSKPRVQFSKRIADYDHLARRKEWADAELDE